MEICYSGERNAKEMERNATKEMVKKYYKNVRKKNKKASKIGQKRSSKSLFIYIYTTHRTNLMQI